MTSHQKSSAFAKSSSSYSNVESLAGVFHPHAIEVQDFSHYSKIIDLRSQSDYDNDHLPGAIRVELPEGTAAEESLWIDQLLAKIATAVPLSRSRRPLLLYCGDAGRSSRRTAEALRGRGLTVDVLPGGWINYRRWVQAGLEVLPRLITFRVIRCSTGEESTKVLRALSEIERQVLDLRELTGELTESTESALRRRPQQALFESRLLHRMRGFDPRRPVWTSEIALKQVGLSMPGALTDSLTLAPAAAIQIDGEGSGELEDVQSFDGAAAVISTRTSEHIIPAMSAPVPTKMGNVVNHTLLPPLRVASFEPKALAAALRAWLPGAEPRLVGV